MIGLKKWLKCLFEELWMRAKKEKKGWSRTLQVLLQRYYYIHSLTAMELSPTTLRQQPSIKSCLQNLAIC
jgi:hypothetical protein